MITTMVMMMKLKIQYRCRDCNKRISKKYEYCFACQESKDYTQEE